MNPFLIFLIIFYEDDDDMHSDNDSPIHPNWAYKSIEAVGDLVGDPHDSRKTRSQFRNAFLFVN